MSRSCSRAAGLRIRITTSNGALQRASNHSAHTAGEWASRLSVVRGFAALERERSSDGDPAGWVCFPFSVGAQTRSLPLFSEEQIPPNCPKAPKNMPTTQ